MISWLKRLFVGCDRECKFVQEARIPVFGFSSKETPEKIIYVLRCATCGRMKNHKVSS